MLRRQVRRPGLGLLGTTVVAGSAYSLGARAANSTNQERRQDARLAELEARAATPAPTPASTPPPSATTPNQPASDARIQQLQQLAELRTAGVLTDAEFEREKSRILES